MIGAKVADDSGRDARRRPGPAAPGAAAPGPLAGPPKDPDGPPLLVVEASDAVGEAASSGAGVSSGSSTTGPASAEAALIGAQAGEQPSTQTRATRACQP